ncbi:hypothetical protein WMY93_023184 [Mugilogobius chulae]|uniref:IQCH-like ATP-grasp domain-containing protein n=1 Tax=Mugilogobius chulae TaxID=88201 RepID=A0AAW0N4P2_9GOBI
MSLTNRNEDNAGAALVQVQDDLRRLKWDLQKLSGTGLGKTLNLEELETAVHKTEHEIRKQRQDCHPNLGEMEVLATEAESSRLRHISILVKKVVPDCCAMGCWFTAVSGQKHYLLQHANKTAGAPHWLCARRSGQLHSVTCHTSVLDILFKCFQSKLCSVPVASIRTSEDAGAGIKTSEFKFPGPLKCETEHIFEETTPPPAKTPPPSITSKSTENTDRVSVSKLRLSLSEKDSENTSILTFTIKLGHIKPSEKDFIVFRKSYSLCWSRVDQALKSLCQLLRFYAVPVAVVKGEQLVELAHSWDSEWRGTPSINSFLSVLDNGDDVLKVLSRPGQRFKGEDGTNAAAVLIQSCWRRHIARSAYLRYCRRKWAVGIIALSWLMHTQICRVRKALQARRFSQLENQRRRAQHLAANWNLIQASKRTIIHVPSLGYSENQRRSLRDFELLQNIQMGRLCEIRDENVEVIYVCPLRLNEDVMDYYSSLLKCNRTQEVGTAGAPENSLSKRRFMILTPEAVDHFPDHSMCLSSLLRHSPRTLQRIRRLIQGKRAYIVPGAVHVDDLAVADELGVPLMAPEPAVAQLYGTKSGARRIFRETGVEMAPGAEDVYSLDQVHMFTSVVFFSLSFSCEASPSAFVSPSLYIGLRAPGVFGTWCVNYGGEWLNPGQELLVHKRWPCAQVSHKQDIVKKEQIQPRKHLEKKKQEPVLLRFLEEVPQWLSSHACPAKTSQHSTWAGFLQTFLRQGGVVQAFPPSDSLSCVTVDLLLEPGGNISMLSCGDQLLSPSGLESRNPPVDLLSCGKACIQKGIVGHVSVDLASFIHRISKQHKVWALDLHLSYSDHLAMTQMLLHNTQGTLTCQNSFDVPMPNTEKSAKKYHPPRDSYDRPLCLVESLFLGRSEVPASLVRCTDLRESRPRLCELRHALGGDREAVQTTEAGSLIEMIEK